MSILFIITFYGVLTPLLQIPEVLVQGHTDDVYGMAFHPKKPHKFATVCDSSNVFLWNAKRRQLMVRGISY